jgi:hypothetical protein
MRMFKKLGFSLMICVLAAIPLAAQTATPETAAVAFYKWYVTELNADRYPVQRQRAKIRQKVSQRLGRWLYSKDAEDYGADYFLSAQDWDPDWAKSVTAKSESPQQGSTAKLRVSFKYSENFGNHQVLVKMVKEAGVWKIDTVDPVEEP